MTLFPECFFNLFGKSLSGIEAEAGHQAVAEADDFVGLGPGGGSGRQDGEPCKNDETQGKPDREFESHA